LDREGVEGREFTWEDLSMEEFFMRGENFHEGGAGFSNIIFFLNNEKINMKKFFN